MKRQWSAIETVVDWILHGAGIGFAAFAGAALLIAAWPAGEIRRVGAVGVFGLALLLVQASSALNHRFRDHRRQALVRLIDQAAIFLLIAGTYTPLSLIALPDPVGIALFALIWVLAAIGVALKIRWRDRHRAALVAFYLAMGWLFIPWVDLLAPTIGAAGLMWLIGGGLAYTIGVPFHLWIGLPFGNAIWHGFVLAGNAAHVVLIGVYIL